MKHRIHNIFICVIAAIICVCGWIGADLLRETKKETVICQEIVELGDMEYDETFLKEAEKIPGVRHISPVLEVPVQLKIDDYTMDAVWTGVQLEEYEMTVRQTWDTFLGTEPVLILGKDSLAGLCDVNGHGISRTKLQDIMEHPNEKQVKYRLVSADDTKEADWKSCRVAGILSEPGDKILIMYEQAKELAGTETKVSEILLTVQGEKQMERAKSFFP